MGHFMWLNLIKKGRVPLQDPKAGPSGSQTQRALPSPALTAPGRGLLSNRIPARWAYQAGGPGSQPANPLPEIGLAPLWGLAPPGGQPLPEGGRRVGPVRRRVGRELGKWGDLRCCHRRESREGLGAPEALGDRVDPAWGGQQALSVTFIARPWT